MDLEGKKADLEGRKHDLEGKKCDLEGAWRSAALQVKDFDFQQVTPENSRLGGDFRKGRGAFCTTGLFTNEIFEDFALNLRLKNYSENTIKSTCYNVKRFLKKMGVSPGQTGWLHIERYVRYLYESGRYSSRSIQTFIQSLKRFYAWLHGTGRIFCDPTSEIEAPELNRNIPKAILSPSEMESIRSQMSGDSLLKLRDKAIVEVLYSTGLRLSELAALDISDMDLNSGILRVRKGKGGRNRRAALNSEAVSAVKTYLETRRLTPDLTQSLWINYRGGRLSGQMIRKILQHYAKAAEVETPAYPHAWRHGLATALLRRGADIVEVQRFLGHVSIKSTQIYTHVMIRDLKNVHTRTHPRERDPFPPEMPVCFSEGADR